MGLPCRTAAPDRPPGSTGRTDSTRCKPHVGADDARIHGQELMEVLVVRMGGGKLPVVPRLIWKIHESLKLQLHPGKMVEVG